MDPYSRIFGSQGGLPNTAASTVPTISTGVPLSMRFKQIQLSQESQGVFGVAQPQRTAHAVNNSYFPATYQQQFQGIPNYPQRGASQFHLQRNMMPNNVMNPFAQMRQLYRGGGGQYRGGGMTRAQLLQNRLSAVAPNGISRFGRGIPRGRALNRLQKAGGRIARVPLAGRIGVANGTQFNRGGNTISTRGGRGRNIVSLRGGRGDFNGQKGGNPSKEELDSELDSYMSKPRNVSKNHLDKELDAYMSKGRATTAAATTTAVNPPNTTSAETPMES